MITEKCRVHNLKIDDYFFWNSGTWKVKTLENGCYIVYGVYGRRSEHFTKWRNNGNWHEFGINSMMFVEKVIQ